MLLCPLGNVDVPPLPISNVAKHVCYMCKSPVTNDLRLDDRDLNGYYHALRCHKAGFSGKHRYINERVFGPMVNSVGSHATLEPELTRIGIEPVAPRFSGGKAIRYGDLYANICQRETLYDSGQRLPFLS